MGEGHHDHTFSLGTKLVLPWNDTVLSNVCNCSFMKGVLVNKLKSYNKPNFKKNIFNFNATIKLKNNISYLELDFEIKSLISLQKTKTEL